MALIIRARAAIGARIRGIGDLPKIVEPRIDRKMIRHITDHFSQKLLAKRLFASRTKP